jgi:hypothetical protein
MSEEETKGSAPEDGPRPRYQVRLPGFISDEAMRRLRTPRRRTQPLVWFFRSAVAVDHQSTTETACVKGATAWSHQR